MVLVRGRHVGLVHEPVRVRRDAVLRREDHAAEVGGGDAHALLRQQRAHRVHGAETGEQEVDTVERFFDAAMRGSVSHVAVSGGGTGRSTSQVSGTRLAGSWASRSWRIVVPVRPWPMITIGGTTSTAATSGCCRRHTSPGASEVVGELAGHDLLAQFVEPRLVRSESASRSSPSCQVGSPKLSSRRCRPRAGRSGRRRARSRT